MRGYSCNTSHKVAKCTCPSPLKHRQQQRGARQQLACVASVSSRVRRESWDESKKKEPFFFGSRSNFRAMITRLETLATQARQQREGKTEPRFRITLLIFNFIAGCLIGFRWGTIVKKRTSDLRYKALVEESFPQVSHSPMHGNGDIFRCSKILSFIIYSELNKDHSTTLIKR